MKRLTIVVLVTMMCSLSQGEVIVGYNFGSNLAATSEGANVTASDIGLSSGLAGYAAHSSTGGGCLYARSSGTGITNLAGAITDIDYVSFTIDVAAGYEMDLTSLTLQQGYTQNGGDTTKSLTADLLTSASGFTSADSLSSITSYATTPNSGSTVYYQSWTIDSAISGAEFLGLTGSTEFRFYLTDDTNNADIIHRFDDIVLNGTVRVGDPVPIADAGYSYVTWLDNGTLALTGTVNDSGDGDVIDTDVVWSIKTSPPGSAATLTKTSTDWANPTANFTPDSGIVGDYTIELTATDAVPQPGSDTLVVQVAADACEAAQLVGVDELSSIYDDDGNCIIDLSDMAAFAAKWMSDVSLTGPVAY